MPSLRRATAVAATAGLLLAGSTAARAQYIPSDAWSPFLEILNALAEAAEQERRPIADGRLLPLDEFKSRTAGLRLPPGATVTPLKREAPFYPYSIEFEGEGDQRVARTVRAEGEAEILAWIGGDGRVRQVAIASASAEAFGLAAADAATKWEFAPIAADGKPAEYWVAIPFRFSAKDSGETAPPAPATTSPASPPAPPDPAVPPAIEFRPAR